MKIQLTISMLVSDRIDTLSKCLESITPLLRELLSELIIVYTGQDPATLELAKKYTSHIIPFTWCDDFAKARNAGLEEAEGEWFLYLDDDEWFGDVTEIIQFFKSGEYKSYQSAMYVQRNYNDWEGKSYIDANVGRMCRLTPETTFIYPIHENLAPFNEPYKQFQTYVHHYGYVESKDAPNQAPKFERNISLLLKLYKEKPTAQNCTQLVQEYKSINDYDTAIRYCREGLRLAAKEERIHTYELWMQVHLPLLLSFSGDKEAALREGELLLAKPRTLEVGRAHLSAILAGLCWELKEYRKGLKYAQRYHKEIAYLKKHPDAALRQNGITVTYESAGERTVPAYVAGLLCAAELNETSVIGELLSWIPWKDEERVSQQYHNLEIWKQSYPELKEVILKGYYLLNTDNGYVNLQKVCYMEYRNRTEDMEKLWKQCVENCPAELKYQLVEMAVRNEFSLNPFLKEIMAEEWDELTDILAEKIDILDMPDFCRRLEGITADYPVFFRRLERRFLEKQFGQENMTISQVYELLQQYCECAAGEAEALYKEEIADALDSYALPYQFRFAGAMRRGLEAFGREDYMGCIPHFEKALHIYPKMSGVISQLMGYIEEKMTAPKPEISEEFRMLGGQVKQMLLGLMGNGQWQEAYGVVNQLLTLMPEDLETLKMKQEIMKQLGTGYF